MLLLVREGKIMSGVCPARPWPSALVLHEFKGAVLGLPVSLQRLAEIVNDDLDDDIVN